MCEMLSVVVEGLCALPAMRVENENIHFAVCVCGVGSARRYVVAVRVSTLANLN